MLERASDSFRILSLALELRTRIWRYAIVKKDAIDLQFHTRQTCQKISPAERKRFIKTQLENDQSHVVSQLALAFTCRQVYLEVTPIYYSEHTFRFYYTIEDFLTNIGSVNTHYITSISVPLDHCPFDIYILQLPHLRAIHAYCFHVTGSESDERHIEQLIEVWSQHRHLVLTHQCDFLEPERSLDRENRHFFPIISRDTTTKPPTFYIRQEELAEDPQTAIGTQDCTVGNSSSG